MISITKQTTNSVYFLDDGTGRLEGRLWLENSNDDDETSNRGIKYVTTSFSTFAYYELTLFPFPENKHMSVSLDY